MCKSVDPNDIEVIIPEKSKKNSSKKTIEAVKKLTSIPSSIELGSLTSLTGVEKFSIVEKDKKKD